MSNQSNKLNNSKQSQIIQIIQIITIIQIISSGKSSFVLLHDGVQGTINDLDPVSVMAQKQKRSRSTTLGHEYDPDIHDAIAHLLVLDGMAVLSTVLRLKGK